ncbi:D-ribose pyranase [subsurface metagenome]|jgi:D-ribose pyranase|nr:D-ribose pyranase [Clostridia bacterium]
MKKSGILNIEISRVIASMGHGDYIVISDAGLPIPDSVELIDVSVSKNIPQFIDVLSSILVELEVGKAILAKEMKRNSPKIYNDVRSLLSGIEIEEIDHKDFKEKISLAKAVIRTGEFSSYSNIILLSEVVF